MNETSLPYPKNTIWLVKAKYFNHQDEQYGTAVAIKLRHNGNTGRFLLTCLHVIDNSDEIWATTTGDAETAWKKLKCVHAPRRTANSIDNGDGSDNRDWAILEFENDQLKDATDDTVEVWSQATDKHTKCAVYGYPGGVGQFEHSARTLLAPTITPCESPTFDNGRLILQGKQTGKGMSGGGLFATDTKVPVFVGIHRGKNEDWYQQYGVAATHIKSQIEGGGKFSVVESPPEPVVSLDTTTGVEIKADPSYHLNPTRNELFNPLRLLFRCDPEDAAPHWKWKVIPLSTTFLLAWSDSAIWLWDATQPSPGHSLATGHVVVGYNDLNHILAVAGRLVAVGFSALTSDYIVIYGITEFFEAIAVTIDRVTVRRKSFTRLQSDPHSVVDLFYTLRHKEVEINGGHFVAVCSTSDSAECKPESSDSGLTLAFGTHNGDKLTWSVSRELSCKHLKARIDSSGEFVLVATSGPVFHLYRPTGECVGSQSLRPLQTFDPAVRTDASPAGSSCEVFVVEMEMFPPCGTGGPSERTNAVLGCWYGSCSDGTVFLASVGSDGRSFNAVSLGVQPNSMIAARYDHGVPQLAIAMCRLNCSTSDRGRYSLRILSWTLGDLQIQTLYSETSDRKVTIRAIIFDDSTDRILVFWSKSRAPITLWTCLHSGPDSSPKLQCSYPTEINSLSQDACLSNKAGLVAVCGHHRLTIRETQGFSRLESTRLPVEPTVELPLHWIEDSPSAPRLITTSKTRGYVWEIATPFYCRVLPRDIGDPEHVQLTSDGRVVYARVEPAELVVERIDGRGSRTVIPVPEKHRQACATLRGLYTCIVSSEGEQVGGRLRIALWSNSHLLIVDHLNEWRTVVECESDEEEIIGVSFNDNITMALLWNSDKLYQVTIANTDNERQRRRDIAETIVAGAVFSKDSRVLYWGEGFVQITGQFRQPGEVDRPVLTGNSQFLICGSDTPGGETVLDVVDVNREIPKFISDARQTESSTLSDVVAVADCENGFAACRRLSIEEGSIVEVILPGRDPITFDTTAFNVRLLSPLPDSLIVFGDNVVELWMIDHSGTASKRASISIDQASPFSGRDCVAIAGTPVSLSFKWSRQDGRMCVASWRPPCR